MYEPRYTHINDGGIYKLLTTVAKLKHPDSGEWYQAVIYEDMDYSSKDRSMVYATTLDRWELMFRIKKLD